MGASVLSFVELFYYLIIISYYLTLRILFANRQEEEPIQLKRENPTRIFTFLP